MNTAAGYTYEVDLTGTINVIPTLRADGWSFQTRQEWRAKRKAAEIRERYEQVVLALQSGGFVWAEGRKVLKGEMLITNDMGLRRYIILGEGSPAQIMDDLNKHAVDPEVLEYHQYKLTNAQKGN